jgi:glycosyltransferase involved in cell wall biosynthesis
MRLLSFVEASTVTGPVKPLLMFSRLARSGVGEHTPIAHTIATTVRTSRRSLQRYDEILSAVGADGLSIDLLPERFRFDPMILSHLATCIRRHAPDILETHDFKCHFLLWLLRRAGVSTDVPWIAFHHGYTKMSPQVRAYQQLDRFSLRKASRVITLCRPFAKDLEARGVQSDRIEIISNAIAPRERTSPADVLELRRSLGIAPTDKVILSVGRLSQEKGHAELLAAYRMLIDATRTGDNRLVLVGDGGERSRLMQQALGLGDRVLFVGHQPDPWPYFCMSDIFVLPSHTEGSPLVLFEAMSAGLAIVASSVGGVPEVVREGDTALLVPPRKAQLLADALRTFLSEPERAIAMGRAAREAVRNHSPQAYAERLLEIYSSAAAEQARYRS